MLNGQAAVFFQAATVNDNYAHGQIIAVTIDEEGKSHVGTPYTSNLSSFQAFVKINETFFAYIHAYDQSGNSIVSPCSVSLEGLIDCKSGGAILPVLDIDRFGYNGMTTIRYNPLIKAITITNQKYYLAIDSETFYLKGAYNQNIQFCAPMITPNGSMILHLLPFGLMAETGFMNNKPTFSVVKSFKSTHVYHDLEGEIYYTMALDKASKTKCYATSFKADGTGVPIEYDYDFPCPCNAS
jgi:hypothetical protein